MKLGCFASSKKPTKETPQTIFAKGAAFSQRFEMRIFRFRLGVAQRKTDADSITR
jgi:hypothetical protein